MTTLEPLRRAVVVGGGTMGVDVAVVLTRGAAAVTVVEPDASRRDGLAAQVRDRRAADTATKTVTDRASVGATTGATLAQAEAVTAPAGATTRTTPIGAKPATASTEEDAAVTVAATVAAVDWRGVALVVECIPERLDLKRTLFAELERLAPAGCRLTSNSSGLPIGEIADGLATASRMHGLHFFMPAHLVPLVEIVQGPHSSADGAAALAAWMRGCGMVPVTVRKDKPGFLANRLQHALAREAFALIDEGVASADDVDAAVRFGFGFRFLAAGPVRQRDLAGLDVHAAAAATIYPSLCNAALPSAALTDRVAQGRLGMKSGAGFEDWPPARAAVERARYEAVLRAGLRVLAADRPDRADDAPTPSR